MLEFLTGLFDTTGFPARWYCGDWSLALGWLHIISDLVIFGAYITIPAVLAYFVMRCRDAPFPKIFWLFSAFIFSCGTIHLIEAIIFWNPVYRFSGVIKLVTAAVSWATVLALIPATPAALALRSPKELEKEIEERMRAEAKLHHYAVELERSNLELERFAYIASHDLQEPLRAVSGFCELLRKQYHEELDDEGREWIDFAVDGAHRMQQMIQGLLTYSRMQSRSKPFEQVDCAEVLKRAIENLHSSIEDTGATITHDQMPTITGDASQLGQLFQNLISNGIKYHGTDAPRIHLSARREGDKWLFALSDNGIGIPVENRDKIFEIFGRLHRQDEYPGTGLGLAVCKGIVERHRGRIWIESEPGEGSTFFFTLPQNTVESNGE